MKVIIDDGLDYNRIYHLSDIHIRNTTKHETEYLHVFNNLYAFLKKDKIGENIIVITGDLLHSKDKLSPMCVNICVNFLIELSSIMKVILIAGNHDFNENNADIEDSINSIIYKRDELSNVHYLRYSGVYKFNNILFGVSSLIDNKFINANEITEKGLKIGLYHGPISNSINSQGFEFSNVSITKFDNYDLVLLGDIHHHQYLNAQKTVAYASSLISQNFTETDANHGVLIWDLKTKESKYQIINNNYRYDELTIKNNDIYYHNQKINIDKLILSSNCRLRVNSTSKNNDEIIKNIQKKYPNILIKENIVSTIKTNIQILTDNKSNVNTLTIDDIVRNELKALETKNKNDTIEIIKKELMETITLKDEIYNWKLLTLEFSNMFSYGPNNKFDFENLTFNELSGLVGENSIGKSSLLDVLLFSLFNKYSRMYTGSHGTRNINGSIINNNYKSFECKICFMINNIKYEIYKYGVKKLKSNKLSFGVANIKVFDFYKYENDNKICLNEFGNKDTQKIITEMIGSYEDFCLTSICLQNMSKYETDFYEMSTTMRKKFLSRLLHLEKFENIVAKYKVHLFAEKKLLIDTQKSNELNNYDINTKQLIEDYNTELLIINDNINKNNKINKDANISLNKCFANLRKLKPEYNKSIKHLNNELKIKKNKLKELKEDKTDYSKKDFDITLLYSENEDLLLNLKKTQYINYNIIELEQKENEFVNIIKHYENKIKEIQIIIKENKTTEKILYLKSLINKDFPQVVINEKIPQHKINKLKSMYESIIVTNNYEKFNCDNYKLLREKHIHKLNLCKDRISHTFIMTDEILNKYNYIDYESYTKELTDKLTNYTKVYEAYIFATTNKDILDLLLIFSIKNNCKCCIDNHNQVESFLNKYNITSYDDIVIKYNELKTIKQELEDITNCHFTLETLKSTKIIELCNNYINIENIRIDSTSFDNYMLGMKEKIYKEFNTYINSNILFDINELEKHNTVFNEYMEHYEQYKPLLEKNKRLLDEVIETKINYEHNKNIYEIIKNNKSKINNIIEIKKKIDNVHLEINIIKTNIKDIKQSITDVEYNSKLYEEITNINKKIEITISDNNQLNEQKYKYEKELHILRNKETNYCTLIDKIKECNKNIDTYSQIISICNIDGIPKKILNSKLEQVETEINKIVRPIINKTIIINKDVNDTDIFVIDSNGSATKVIGGMESFVISVACKVALTQFFNIPNPGILIIDEGVSVFDKGRVNNFHVISNFIKKYYNNVIIITHIEAFNEHFEQFIKVHKQKTGSYVYFSKDNKKNVEIIL